MTPDELRALADRVVACRHWRPMRGMRDLQGRTWTPDLLWRWHPHDRPDLSDPATVGCLLALVREAWGDPEAHLALGAGGWILMSGESRVAEVVYPSPAGRIEAEALVAALEASPTE